MHRHSPRGAGDTGTDAWWRRGKLRRVREWCKRVRDAGVLVAITSHRPEVFMEIESQGWDVDYYMTCLYKYGRTHAEWLKAYQVQPRNDARRNRLPHARAISAAITAGK